MGILVGCNLKKITWVLHSMDLIKNNDTAFIQAVIKDSGSAKRLFTEGKSQLRETEFGNILAGVVFPTRRTPESHTIGLSFQTASIFTIQNGRFTRLIVFIIYFRTSQCKVRFYSTRKKIAVHPQINLGSILKGLLRSVLYYYFINIVST